MNDAALLAVLAEMRDEIRALRFAVEKLMAPRCKDEPDEAAIANLLRAIDAAIGARSFLCSHLRDHALLHDGEPLRAAIIAAAGAMNMKRLGRLFSKIEGRAIGGYEVHLVSSKDRKGTQWQILAADLRI